MTELKIRESEERFRHLADDSPMFIFIIEADPEAPVSYWNKTWLQYTGQTLDEAIGRAWNGIIHTDDLAVVMEHYMPAFQNRQSYFIPAVRVKRHDGEYRWHAFKGNPRYLPNGDFDGYIGVGFDIHEQKLSEEIIKHSEAQLQQKVQERTKKMQEAQHELERTVEELKRSNINLEEFAFAASHDLKEPLRKVRTFADRLKYNLQGRLSEGDQHYFDRMEKATERMQSLIDDLLAYSHVSTSSTYLDEVDVNKKVAQVLEDLEIQVADKKANVVVGELPVIKGHRRQILQLFQNLITNALKFTKPGITPEIRISSAVVSGEDITSFSLPEESQHQSFNVIEIADNGIGFEQQHADTIFKMFQRLHGKTEYEGTGIGLAIVRKVVENHKGFITAESEPGEGATFRVFLPIE
jgi:PAS domain S-box-containing protein